MKVLVCENNSSGTGSPFMVTDCLGKHFIGINITDSVSDNLTQEEQSPLMRRQLVCRTYSEQMTEKQNSVKLAPSPRKRKYLPYLDILVASIKKGKNVQLSRYESVELIQKQQLANLKNHSVKIVLKNNSSLLPGTNVPNRW